MKFKLIAAFASVYIVWGSTYLAILYAIDTLPPWTLTAMRFVVASLCIGVVALIRREGPLSRLEKKTAFQSGVLLVLANGIVCVLEKWVPSGIAAVVIGAMPIWIMMVGWAAFGTGRPDLRKTGGATIGLLGIAMIAAGNSQKSSGDTFAQFAPLVLCVSSLLWATGTLLQRKATNVKSGISFLAVQMASGAGAAVLMSFVFESPLTFDWASVSSNSWLALAYLIVFGSLIGFTAYSWLSRNVEPHLVSTYALVNPIIAVWLGWFLRDEPLTGKFVLATALVLIGLTVLMVRKKPAAV
jgi:drug/metabolite transporter (DMT)-like permease